MKVLKIMAVLILLYVGAFLVIHRSSSFVRPAANLAYWYYSDNRAVEVVDFYGFWPLRQTAYHLVPGFTSRHSSERVYPTPEQLRDVGE